MISDKITPVILLLFDVGLMAITGYYLWRFITEF